MPIQKFRSLEEIEISWVKPGTPEHSRSIRAVIALVSLFAPKNDFHTAVLRTGALRKLMPNGKFWEQQRD